MKINTRISNQTFDQERSLYGVKNSEVFSCKFSGPNDGESPLKETSIINVHDCEFDLRYPLWHSTNLILENSSFSNLSRAPLWYDKNVVIKNTNSQSPKIFRECENIKLENCKLESEEPFWKCSKITGNSCIFSGFYGFFSCKNISLFDVKFSGKYSFQYCKNIRIFNSEIDTKDAFWHSKNVYIKDSIIKGEYIGWYSSNLTFVNCIIESHQPFCYSNSVTFINCKMPNCDLAFEKTSIKGNVTGKINSIKNPRKASFKVEEIGELIQEKKNRHVHIKITGDVNK